MPWRTIGKKPRKAGQLRLVTPTDASVYGICLLGTADKSAETLANQVPKGGVYGLKVFRTVIQANSTPLSWCGLALHRQQ